MLQSVPCSCGTRGQQQWACLWEVCPGRGASLLTDRKEVGKQGEEYWSKKEKVKKEFNYLPWDRHKRADRMHDMEDSLSSVQCSEPKWQGTMVTSSCRTQQANLCNSLPAEFWVFLVIGQFTRCWACDDRHGVPVAKQEKNLCTGVFKAHWKSFRLNLKGKGTKPLSLEISLGVAH